MPRDWKIQVQNILCINIVLKNKKHNVCTQYVPNLYFLGNSINNLLSNCGLTDARMRASELPVINVFIIFVSEDTEVFGNY